MIGVGDWSADWVCAAGVFSPACGIISAGLRFFHPRGLLRWWGRWDALDFYGSVAYAAGDIIAVVGPLKL